MRLMFAERGTGEPISLGGALWAGKKVPATAINLLLMDHRTVEGWFDWYDKAEPAQKPEIARRICLALTAHERAEDDVFYEAVRPVIGDELATRARQQEDEARQIIAGIEERNGDAPEAVARLRAGVEAHIATEEGEVFPRVLASDIDLYDIGRNLAARRLEMLFKLTAAAPQSEPHLKELAAMHISKDEARDLFVDGLRNAHAVATQGRTVLDAQLSRLENYPKVKAKLEENRRQKDLQLERFEQILESLGHSPSSFKDTTMSMAGSLTSMMNSGADDEILKNSFATFALASYEVAAFETLLLLAEAAGETAAMPPIQECVSEERAAAAFIADHLRETGMRFLQLRSEGRQASH